MKMTKIDKQNLFTSVIENDVPIKKFFREWFEMAEFDFKKNIAMINQDKWWIICFQNSEPNDKNKEWDDEFNDFCDYLLEEHQGTIQEGDCRVFCGVTEVLDGN